MHISDGPVAEDSRRHRVLATVDAIPVGRVATYGQVAEEAALPGRARWVGRVLSELPDDSPLPWWRVVRADGHIAERAGQGAARQAALLAAEGVELNGFGRVDLPRRQWKPTGQNAAHGRLR